MPDQVIPAKLLEGLSQEQKRVVTSRARYLRVLAGAGAGKTETMTRRIVTLLARGEAPSSIVAFTFTDRAAAEIKERIYIRVNELLGKEVAARLGDLYVGTIHAYCMRVLQDYYGYGLYDVLDPNQEMAFLLREASNLGLSTGGELTPTRSLSANCQIFQYSVNVVQDELLDKKRLRKLAPDFADGLERYETLLESHRILTFGRMVALAVVNLEKDHRPLNHVRWLIVDEFQDVNRAQERLVALLGESASSYVVGDPRQCVYGWRGSDPSSFDRFSSRYHANQSSMLANRRSCSNVVAIGNRIASSFAEPSLRAQMEEHRKAEGTVLSVEHETPEEEAEWIARQIDSLLTTKVCTPSDVAILLRSVKTSGSTICRALKRKGIPYIVGGNLGLFGRDEAVAMGAIFLWLGDLGWKDSPWDEDEVTPAELPSFASDHWPGGIPRKTLESFRRTLLAKKFRNLSSAFHSLLRDLGVVGWDPEDPESAVRLANLGRFGNLLDDFEAARRRGGRVLELSRDLHNLAWFIRTQGISGYDEQQADDLDNVEAVQVMTVHQAKGLEWPVVIVPALTNERFPSKLMGRGRRCHVPDSLYEVERYCGNLEDERKIFYVAATRARDALALSRFTRISRSCAPSVFLANLDLDSTRNSPTPFVSKVEPRPPGGDDIVSYSPSEILDYRRCPHKYRLSSLWGYDAGVVLELGYGKAVHHVLHQIALEAKRGIDPLKVLNRILDSEFHMPYAPRKVVEARKKAARKKLEKYVREHRQDFANIEEVEARLEFRLVKSGTVVATVSGRVDTIIAPDGQRELRDYKTLDLENASAIQRRSATEDASFQIRTYAVGERELGRPVEKASIAFLHTGEVSEVKIGEADLAATRFDAKNAVEGIISRRFPGTPGRHCRGCDFKAICRFCDKSALGGNQAGGPAS